MAAHRAAGEVRVTTAAQASSRDQSAIGAGTPSFDLMVRAGSAAAALILRDYAAHLSYGVAVLAGHGNNGGDAYIVAAQLARAGVAVRVHAAAPPRTPDATQAAALAQPHLMMGAPTGRERVVIDGLLGTGHSGPLREAMRAECEQLSAARDRGAVVIALDVPSGLDASTGAVADGSVAADCTVSFGTLKRGLLLQRAHAGRIVVVDIGLAAHAEHPHGQDDGAWRWADAPDAHRRTPRIAWNAHKGVRGRVGLAGGDTGMAGAVVLAARAALGAGAGLVHAIVDEPSVAAVQALVPEALAHRWPTLPAPRRAGMPTPSTSMPTPSDFNAEPRYDALGIGPGLGRGRGSAQVMQRLLDLHRGIPVVLDADALWLAADAASAIGTDSASMVRHWTRDATHVVCTPHPGEMARLLGGPLPSTWDGRVEQLAHFAARAGVTMLLKGTPTLIATPDAQPPHVVPHGTAILATGGSGDCLTGIIATLLAQGANARDAAIVGATVHGRAAELATQSVGVRGGTLEDVLAHLPAAWRVLSEPVPLPPGVLAEL